MPSTSGQQNFFSGEKKKGTKPFKSTNVPRLLVHGQHSQGPYWYTATEVGTTAETDVQIQVCTFASTELDPIFLDYVSPHLQNASAWHFFILRDF